MFKMTHRSTEALASALFLVEKRLIIFGDVVKVILGYIFGGNHINTSQAKSTTKNLTVPGRIQLLSGDGACAVRQTKFQQVLVRGGL